MIENCFQFKNVKELKTFLNDFSDDTLVRGTSCNVLKIKVSQDEHSDKEIIIFDDIIGCDDSDCYDGFTGGIGNECFDENLDYENTKQHFKKELIMKINEKSWLCRIIKITHYGELPETSCEYFNSLLDLIILSCFLITILFVLGFLFIKDPINSSISFGISLLFISGVFGIAYYFNESKLFEEFANGFKNRFCSKIEYSKDEKEENHNENK